MVSPSPTISITFELAFNEDRKVTQESNRNISSSMIFRDVIQQILEDPIYATVKHPLKNMDIYCNRSPKTPFFPIAANNQQLEAFQRSLNNPPHTKIPDGDYDLMIDAIIHKYKIQVFTVYLKH